MRLPFEVGESIGVLRNKGAGYGIFIRNILITAVLQLEGSPLFSSSQYNCIYSPTGLCKGKSETSPVGMGAQG